MISSVTVPIAQYPVSISAHTPMPLSQRAFWWQKELSRPISVQIFQNSTSAMAMGTALRLMAIIPGVTSQASSGSSSPISRIRLGKIAA